MEATKTDLILYVGNARPPEYGTILGKGLNIGLIFDRSTVLGRPEMGAFSVVEEVPSLSDPSLLVDAFLKISKKYNVTAVMNVVEPSVMAHAQLCETIGYCGPSRSSAMRSLNKTLMRKAFCDEIGADVGPVFDEIETEDCLLNFCKQSGFPIVLKPVNLMGSMFISRNGNYKELLNNYRKTVPALVRYLATCGRGDEKASIQAESLLEGSNHSMDCLVDREGNVYPTPIVDVLTGQDIGKSDFHHFARICPSALSKSRENACLKLAEEGCRALNLKSCAAHVEFVYTEQGPKLLEIAARPGGNRPRILKEVYGIDFIYAYYSMLIGMKPDLTPTKGRVPMAVVSPYPDRCGTLAGNRLNGRLETLKCYRRHTEKVPIGTAVGPAEKGFLPPVTIELYGDNIEELKHDLERISSWQDIYIMTE